MNPLQQTVALHMHGNLRLLQMKIVSQVLDAMHVQTISHQL